MRSATARRRRSRRARTRLATVLSATGALLLAVTVVWQSASAGFTDPTSPLGATAATATISLADDDSGSVLFAATGLKPGRTATRCITVTSTSTLPAEVQMYVSERRSTNGLASWLKLTVRSGTGGSFAGCGTLGSSSSVYDGTLAGFPTAWTAGRPSWSTTVPSPAGAKTTDKRTYEIKYSVDANAPLSVQGGTASVDLVWESRTK